MLNSLNVYSYKKRVISCVRRGHCFGWVRVLESAVESLFIKIVITNKLLILTILRQLNVEFLTNRQFLYNVARKCSKFFENVIT